MHKNIKQNDYSRYAANRDVISLFSGAMGLDIGLGKAGLNIVIGQDFDVACVKTMKANGHKVLGGDIRKIQPQQLLDMTGLSVGEPFLICGGPPCQPFSTAGKRLGINDPRGSLFMDFIRMIDYIRPRFFVMENVKGMKDDEYNIVANMKSSKIQESKTKSAHQQFVDQLSGNGLYHTFGTNAKNMEGAKNIAEQEKMQNNEIQENNKKF